MPNHDKRINNIVNVHENEYEGNPLVGEWESFSPHEREENLDPKVHGPFLDDIRADQERAYRDRRNSKDKVTKRQVLAGSPGLNDEEVKTRQSTVMRDDFGFERQVAEKLVSHPSATSDLEPIRPSDGDVFDETKAEASKQGTAEKEKGLVARVNKANAKRRVKSKTDSKLQRGVIREDKKFKSKKAKVTVASEDDATPTQRRKANKELAPPVAKKAAKK